MPELVVLEIRDCRGRQEKWDFNRRGGHDRLIIRDNSFTTREIFFQMPAILSIQYSLQCRHAPIFNVKKKIQLYSFIWVSMKLFKQLMFQASRR